MANGSLNNPVLLQRIPSHPWGDPKDRHVVGYDEYVKTGGYRTLKQAHGMKPEAIVDMVKESQLRGRGGAGFPCGLKWTFLPEPDGGRRYLAVNCDEAEPGTFKDRLLIDFDPHLVLEGIAITCHACRIDTAYFFIRGEYRHQARVVENAIQEAYDHGIFGPRKGHGTVEGYRPRDAVEYSPFTVLSGVLEKHTGEKPFDVPAAQRAAIREGRFGAFAEASMHSVPVNFLSTVDTTGGNSCSPTLNGRGELVGLLFDGNWESIISDWDFLPDSTRSIHVDIRYVLWMMSEVDGAGHLLEEMGVEG